MIMVLNLDRMVEDFQKRSQFLTFRVNYNSKNLTQHVANHVIKQNTA